MLQFTKKVDEQLIGEKLCSCNTFEDIRHYSLWLSLKIDKVAITHLAMGIHFQTSDHVVAVEIVAEQHIGTKLCSCNTFEDISHLLIMVIIKVAITQLPMELQL